MLAACLLLAIAVLSGTLLTLWYDRIAPLPARIAMGAATGLPLLATAGYLTTLWLGPTSKSAGLAVILMLLPVAAMLNGSYRQRIVSQFHKALESASQALRQRSRNAIAYTAFYAVLALFLGWFFSYAMYQTPQGIFTGMRNNLGDGPLHLQVISSFAQGHNFPPEDPTYAGVRFAYPFLVDFLSSMLVRAGADMLDAMWVQSMVTVLALVGVLHYWTLLLTRNRLAGLIAPILVLFSGGLGWAWLLQDLHNSDGLIPLLAHLPHDYTILDSGDILRWGNSLTTLFVPQRSILFGMPLAICIFIIWWRTIDQRSQEAPGPSRREMIAPGVPGKPGVPRSRGVRELGWKPGIGLLGWSGLFAGLLPLVHAHTFLVVMGVGACLALLFARLWKGWAGFFLVATVVALSQVRWLAGGVKLQSYVAWLPGWDHGQFPPFLFWLVNTGLFIPLLLLALFWDKPETSLPRQVLRYYAPFTLCFIVPNLIKVAPWVWDNIKVLFWWYVASAPLVAWMVARGIQARGKWRWLSIGALLALTMAGALDILRVLSGATELLEFDPQGIAMAKMISQQSGPRAVVLHDPTFNSPVFLTGRRSLMGYAGWMWSRGLDSSQRQAEIQRMYSGAPDAESLLRGYGVQYVLIGPAEVGSLPVNLQFWSRYPVVAQAGPYRLYKTNLGEERNPR